MHGDTLETDWESLLPPQKCSHIFGNQPFVGAKYQNDEQRAQVRRIADLGKSGGTLDYVCAWFIKAGAYARGSTTWIGFVATNAITQGEQVAQLWPILFDPCGLEIAFAHRTFAWGSDARGKAHVHVVILGLTPHDHISREKRLFSYPDINGEPDETQHDVLSPYLFDASQLRDPHFVVCETSKPLNGLPRLIIGSEPIDGGHYIFTAEEKNTFLEEEPEAEEWFRPFIGSREFLNGGERYILHLADAPPNKLAALPKVQERTAAVRKYREGRDSKPTQKLAQTPTLYHVNVAPEFPFLILPKVSSERRNYLPIGWKEPPTIPSDLVFVLNGATRPIFALLTSAMHMSWMRHIGGRLKSDYRYAIGLVYNTFPLPSVADKALAKLNPLAQAVLDARAEHPDASLADLYDPDLMPVNLRKAHQALDCAVDHLYRRSGFASGRERVEHFLGLYEKYIAPLMVTKPKRRRRSGRAGPSSP